MRSQNSRGRVSEYPVVWMHPPMLLLVSVRGYRRSCFWKCQRNRAMRLSVTILLVIFLLPEEAVTTSASITQHINCEPVKRS